MIIAISKLIAKNKFIVMISCTHHFQHALFNFPIYDTNNLLIINYLLLFEKWQVMDVLTMKREQLKQ